MENKRGLKVGLRSALPKLIFGLCVIQPILDIAGYWQNYLGISNTLTMLLRMLLLGGTVLLGFYLSDRKRYYVITAAVLLALTAGHVYACLHSFNGYEEPILDLINLVRIYFLPMTAICAITFLRQNDEVFPAMQKGMVVDIVIIFCVQAISTITGTNPYTYSVDQVGILGWFMWTNSQSAILAMLCPIAICWCVRRWKDKIAATILMTFIAEAPLYVLAPRLSYASLVACGFGLAVCLVILDRKTWKKAVAIALITALFCAAYPFSPTYSRLHANERRAQKEQEVLVSLDIHIPTRPTETETEKNTDVSAESETVVPTEKPEEKIILDKKTAKKLEKFYRSHDLMWSLVSRFGAERIFEVYGYSLDPAILSSTRLMKINFCKLVMEDSGPASKLFGLDLRDMTAERQDAKGELVRDNFDVENDFHGIYFLTGIIGLVLMIAFLLYFGLRALIAVLKKPKIYFNLEMIAFAMAYGFGLIHAYFTASVLRRNNASFYLALVLAGLWYLSQKQKPTEKE